MFDTIGLRRRYLDTRMLSIGGGIGVCMLFAIRQRSTLTSKTFLSDTNCSLVKVWVDREHQPYHAHYRRIA